MLLKLTSAGAMRRTILFSIEPVRKAPTLAERSIIKLPMPVPPSTFTTAWASKIVIVSVPLSALTVVKNRTDVSSTRSFRPAPVLTSSFASMSLTTT